MKGAIDANLYCRPVAIGSGYAARLSSIVSASSLDDVLLVTRRSEARDALNEGLFIQRSGEKDEVVKVEARLPDEIQSDSEDLVLLTAKTFDNSELLPFISRVGNEEGVCLSLQNGVGNLPAMYEDLGKGLTFQPDLAHVSRPGVVASV